MSSPILVGQANTQFESIAHAYFGALADGDLSRVPWHRDVVLRAPLAEHNPLVGRDAVEAYLRPLAGNLGEVRILQIFMNEAANAMAVEAAVGPLHVMDKFVIGGGLILEQQNFYDPRPVLDAPAPGGLTAEERALLIQKLEESREAVREFLSAVGIDELTRKPQTGGWTVLECAEHLVLTEEALLRMIRNQILRSEPNTRLAAELHGRDGSVITAMTDRSRKVATFEFLVPRGQYASAAHALDAFLARRAATLDFVRTTREAVHYHASPLEGLGLLNAYHWLLLMAGHTGRHVAQMREALA